MFPRTRSKTKTRTKDTPPTKFQSNTNCQKMEIDSEEQDDDDRFFEWEEASATFDEEQNHIVPASADEVLCDKLLHLHSPTVDLERTGIKST